VRCDATHCTFDTSLLTFDILGAAALADLCTFDSTLTTFDETDKRFDQTTCQAATPAPQAQQRLNLKRGGGGYKPTRQDAYAQLVKLANEFREVPRDPERQLPPPEPVIPERVPFSSVLGKEPLKAPKRKPRKQVKEPIENDEEMEVVLLASLL
jgi:hypothetical protein